MDKKVLLELIIEKLLAEAESYVRAAKAAHAEATDEQSRADNKYDTRGLEASYLARGQSKQVAEVETSILEYQKIAPRIFAPKSPIEVGALVQMGTAKDRAIYFIGPRAGGIEVEIDGEEVTVLTPSSPLGQQLIGKKQGDKIKLPAGGREMTIVSVT